MSEYGPYSTKEDAQLARGGGRSRVDTSRGCGRFDRRPLTRLIASVPAYSPVQGLSDRQAYKSYERGS